MTFEAFQANLKSLPSNERRFEASDGACKLPVTFPVHYNSPLSCLNLLKLNFDSKSSIHHGKTNQVIPDALPQCGQARFD